MRVICKGTRAQNRQAHKSLDLFIVLKECLSGAAVSMIHGRLRIHRAIVETKYALDKSSIITIVTGRSKL